MCVFVSFITLQHFCFQLHLKFTVGLIPSGGGFSLSMCVHSSACVVCLCANHVFADTGVGT